MQLLTLTAKSMPVSGLSSLAVLLLSACLTGVNAAPDWQWRTGRATNYGGSGDPWSIHRGSCRYEYLDPTVNKGWDIAALSDAAPDFQGSCGRCYEIGCAPMHLKDGYGTGIDRSNACYDTSKTVVVMITDTCPCDYPPNQYSNKRWCCNDYYHFDMSTWAFEKLAQRKWGVIGVRYREVPCSYCPENPAMVPEGSSPEPAQNDPPSGWQPSWDKRPLAQNCFKTSLERPDSSSRPAAPEPLPSSGGNSDTNNGDNRDANTNNDANNDDNGWAQQVASSASSSSSLNFASATAAPSSSASSSSGWASASSSSSSTGGSAAATSMLISTSGTAAASSSSINGVDSRSAFTWLMKGKEYSSLGKWFDFTSQLLPWDAPDGKRAYCGKLGGYASISFKGSEGSLSEQRTLVFDIKTADGQVPDLSVTLLSTKKGTCRGVNLRTVDGTTRNGDWAKVSIPLIDFSWWQRSNPVGDELIFVGCHSDGIGAWDIDQIVFKNNWGAQQALCLATVQAD